MEKETEIKLTPVEEKIEKPIRLPITDKDALKLLYYITDLGNIGITANTIPVTEQSRVPRKPADYIYDIMDLLEHYGLIS